MAKRLEGFRRKNRASIKNVKHSGELTRIPTAAYLEGVKLSDSHFWVKWAKPSPE